jgi:hypothetical protein
MQFKKFTKHYKKEGTRIVVIVAHKEESLSHITQQ